jgi:flavodoxin I
MADLLEGRGARIIGLTPVKGYEFENSRAVRGDQFCGLALDFENQASQINGKIKKWAEQVKKEFGEGNKKAGSRQ